jgi:hypothetical protein
VISARCSVFNTSVAVCFLFSFLPKISWGEPTERGQLWRAVVARNLDRFSGWIAVQRTRLDSLWERLERAMARPDERDGETRQGGQEQKPAEQSGFTPEQRDRLLGRGQEKLGKERPERDENER